jgi:hypothetical protein
VALVRNKTFEQNIVFYIHFNCFFFFVEKKMTDVLLEKQEQKPTYADVLSKKALAYVQKQLHDKEYYDAYSMICTFVHRCIHRSQYIQALDLCHDFGLEFINHQRFDLACELGDLIITMLMEASLSVTQQRIQYILDIFEPFPDNCEISRHRFIEHALKWAIQNAGPDSPFVTQLHYAAGISYMKEKNYALAQGHLIFCGDGELLGTVVAQWLKEGYYSERPLFVLRLILLLLAKGDIKTAEETFYSKGIFFFSYFSKRN